MTDVSNLISSWQFKESEGNSTKKEANDIMLYGDA